MQIFPLGELALEIAMLCNRSLCNGKTESKTTEAVKCWEVQASGLQAYYADVAALLFKCDKPYTAGWLLP